MVLPQQILDEFMKFMNRWLNKLVEVFLVKIVEEMVYWPINSQKKALICGVGQFQAINSIKINLHISQKSNSSYKLVQAGSHGPWSEWKITLVPETMWNVSKFHFNQPCRDFMHYGEKIFMAKEVLH